MTQRRVSDTGYSFFCQLQGFGNNIDDPNLVVYTNVGIKQGALCNRRCENADPVVAL